MPPSRFGRTLIYRNWHVRAVEPTSLGEVDQTVEDAVFWRMAGLHSRRVPRGERGEKRKIVMRLFTRGDVIDDPRPFPTPRGAFAA